MSFNAAVGGSKIPTSSTHLYKGGDKLRFLCTVNGILYVHLHEADYEAVFSYLPAPMLPSPQFTVGSYTNRQTFTIGTVIDALVAAGCGHLAVVSYGLKQRIEVTNAQQPAFRFTSPSHSYIKQMLDASSFFTLDVGCEWPEGGDSFLFCKPGKRAGGLKLFEVLTPVQVLTGALIHLEANPHDTAGTTLRAPTWKSGTITAYGKFLGTIGGFDIAAVASASGPSTAGCHDWYSRGLRGEDYRPGAGATGVFSGVTAVCLYNNDTRHACVASAPHGGFSAVGTVRKKNKPPAASAAAHGAGQPPPWGPQHMQAARTRHNADLQRDASAVTTSIGTIQRFPTEQFGGVRSEAKIVSVSPSAYAFAAALRDGYRAASTVADTDRSGIRVAARIPKSVQDGLSAAVLKWAEVMRADAASFALMLQQTVSQMGTHVAKHSSSRTYMRNGSALRALLGPVVSAGLVLGAASSGTSSSSGGGNSSSGSSSSKSKSSSTPPQPQQQASSSLARQPLQRANRQYLKRRRPKHRRTGATKQC
jgi:hypothetical protein